MTDQVNLTPHTNFALHNLPPNSESFYNTQAFAQGEIHFLGTMMSIMQKSFEVGQKSIKDAINGQS